METAMQRISEQWGAITNYNMKLPNEHTNKSCENNERYKKIRQFIQKHELHVQLHFLKCISSK